MNKSKIIALCCLFNVFFNILNSQEKTKSEITVAPIKDIRTSNSETNYKTSGKQLSSTNTSSRSVSSTDAADIGSPSASPFQLGADISGLIQNSVNEVTGKVTFSVPLGAVGSGPISYNLGLNYNGASSFKQGNEKNKYSHTSTIGVGWSLPIEKIIVD